MKRLFLSAIFLVLAGLTAFAGRVTLSGVAPSYSGKTIELKCFSDQIVYSERVIAASVVDTAGRFFFSADIDDVLQAFIPMDVCRGYIYLEPGKDYKIELPEYAERTLPQKLDPFFRPKDFLLTIKDLKKGDFNFQMMEFEDAFDYYSMKHIVYGTKADSVRASVAEMKGIFPDLNAQYQHKFKEYRYLLLMNMSDLSKDSIIAEFNKLGADVYNSAFWDAFNNIFNEFVETQMAGKEEFFVIKKIVEEENSKMLYAMLKNRYGITDKSLADLAAIKIIMDLTNSSHFNKVNVFNVLTKMYADMADEEGRRILISAQAMVSTNFIGTEAPDFDAVNYKGKTCRLSDLKGKYVYINVCNSRIDQTLKDLNVLVRFCDAYKKDLVVLNVFLYDETGNLSYYPPVMKDKMEFWTVPDSDEFKRVYGIRNVPSYFLLDRDGKFLMSQGAEPNDNLRLFLQNIIK